nr:hypothetical protein Iba_chr08aCG7100 [Ipomoea batatas]
MRKRIGSRSRWRRHRKEPEIPGRLVGPGPGDPQPSGTEKPPGISVAMLTAAWTPRCSSSYFSPVFRPHRKLSLSFAVSRCSSSGKSLTRLLGSRRSCCASSFSSSQIHPRERAVTNPRVSRRHTEEPEPPPPHRIGTGF